MKQDEDNTALDVLIHASAVLFFITLLATGVYGCLVSIYG